MTSLKMRDMKESGVEWIGEVPSDWKIVPQWSRLRITKELVGSDWDSTQLLSLTKQGVITRDIDSGEGKYPESFEGYQFVEPGDLIFCLFDIDETPRTVGMSRIQGMITSAYTRMKVIGDTDSRFLEWYFLDIDNYKKLRPFYTGLRKVVTKERFLAMRMALPPLEEQLAIADFLDRETAQIDELVTKQYQLVELLLERRRGLIGHAVTKGLCNDESLTSSGDALIGSIPNTWLVNRVSRLFTARKGSNAAELTAEHCATISGEYPVYSGQTSNDGVMASIDSYEFDAGTSGVIFTTTVGAKAMTTKLLFGKFSLSQNCMVIQPREKESINVAFASWFFEFLLPLKKAEMSNHMQTSFRMSDLAEYKIVVPPLEVQAGIVEYLNDVTSKIDALISRARSFASILEERRQALISAAVTGKIDVRGK